MDHAPVEAEIAPEIKEPIEEEKKPLGWATPRRCIL